MAVGMTLCSKCSVFLNNPVYIQSLENKINVYVSVSFQLLDGMGTKLGGFLCPCEFPGLSGVCVFTVLIHPAQTAPREEV